MSNSGEPPQKTNQPPSFFSSLPEELVLEILARVPRRHFPILSYVSKTFRNLVRSPEIHKIRSNLDLDSLYISFLVRSSIHSILNWYTLRRIVENNPAQNLFTSIDLRSPPNLNYKSVIAIGPEIFFLGGPSIQKPEPSSSFFIFDSRSRTFRQGPDMLVKRYSRSVGFVSGKIYVIGGYKGEDDVFQAESFDLKKQIWEFAPVPERTEIIRWICAANVSLNKKIYALSCLYGMSSYDTRDGSYERFELPNGKWSGVCVIENVIYVYFGEIGLMWFDTEVETWKVVEGLSHMEKVGDVGMAEYYGKMAFLWEEESGEVNGESKEIWCRLIGLVSSGGGIHGTAELPQRLGTVPRSYGLMHCLSVSN